MGPGHGRLGLLLYQLPPGLYVSMAGHSWLFGLLVCWGAPEGGGRAAPMPSKCIAVTPDSACRGQYRAHLGAAPLLGLISFRPWGPGLGVGEASAQKGPVSPSGDQLPPVWPTEAMPWLRLLLGPCRCNGDNRSQWAKGGLWDKSQQWPACPSCTKNCTVKQGQGCPPCRLV